MCVCAAAPIVLLRLHELDVCCLVVEQEVEECYNTEVMRQDKKDKLKRQLQFPSASSTATTPASAPATSTSPSAADAAAVDTVMTPAAESTSTTSGLSSLLPLGLFCAQFGVMLCCPRQPLPPSRPALLPLHPLV